MMLAEKVMPASARVAAATTSSYRRHQSFSLNGRRQRDGSRPPRAAPSLKPQGGYSPQNLPEKNAARNRYAGSFGLPGHDKLAVARRRMCPAGCH